MINLYSVNNVKLGLLENLKDFVIVDKLKNGNSTLSFSLYRNDPYCKEINEECYIETFDNRYIVKSINNQQTVIRYNCELDLESLTSKIWKDGFSNARAAVLDTVKLAIAGAGWTVVSQNLTDKKRSINLKPTDSLEIIKSCLVKWDVEVKFDAKNRVITLSDKVGEDKGIYFSDELNLTTINIESESKSFATRLYVRGKDGLTFASLNGGKDYIEDFTYTNKIVSKIWIDERYESSEQLLEDSKLKLNDYCRPKVTYELEIVDLASLSENYSFLEYGIGDSVTLLSVDKELREVHRIVELMRYPLEPERNTATLSNGQLTFEEAQEKNESMAEDIDSVLNEDGTLNGSKVDGITTNQIIDFEAQVGSVVDFTAVNAKIENLQANKASIGQLSAVQADIGDLRANTATIDQLSATNAKITTLESDNIKVNGLLEASSAQIKVLEADTATIKHLVNGNLSSENIQAGGITSDKLTIANGFIKNAMIDSLNANKITAGQINTALVNVTSSSGNLVINDNTIQIRDNSRVRVQIGKDASNDYSMSVWDSSGQLMFDARGLKANAIKDSIIRNDMISSSASIDGSKLNISSVVSSINNGSSTLKASKVQFDGIAQTLEVAFNSLKTNVEGIEIGGANIATKTNQGTTGWGWAMEVGGVTKIEHVENNIRGCKFVRNDVVQSGWSYISYSHIGRVKYKSNTDYTISFEIKSSVVTQFLVDIKYGNSTETLTNSAKTGQCVANEWTKLSVTLKTKTALPSGTQQVLYLAGMSSTVGVSYIFRNLKIEVGNKSTDWTPAPEDIGEAVSDVKQITESNTTAINIAQGKVNTLIQDTTITKDGKETKLKDEYSKLEQTVGGISTTVGKQQTTIDDHTGKITSTNSELSTLKQNVDGISANVSSAQTTIQSHTTLIGQKANSVDVYTKSQTDAAISVAKENINLSVSTNYETKTNVENKITSAKSETKTYADNKVDAVQIGGTNLIRNSGNFSNLVDWALNGATTFDLATKDGIKTITGIGSIRNETTVPIEANSYYVYSAEVMFTEDTPITGSSPIHYWLHDGTSTTGAQQSVKLMTSTLAKANKWTRVQILLQTKATLPMDGATKPYFKAFLYGTMLTSTNQYWIKNIQFEKGTKASAWNYAPEDVTKDIDKAKSDAINSAATDATTKVGNAKNELNTNINKKANAVDVYSKSETYTKGQTDSAINIAKDSINLGVSNTYETKTNVDTKVTTAVGNVQVGSTNLVDNSDFSRTLTYWSTQDMSTGGSSKSISVIKGGDWADPNIHSLQIIGTSCAGRYGVASTAMTLLPNTKYVISGYCAGHRVGKLQVNVRDNTNGAANIHTIEYSPVTGGNSITKMYRFETTFTTTANTLFTLNLYAVDLAANGYAWFSRIKLEKGTKSSDWSPSLTDTKEIIDAAKQGAIDTAASDATNKVTGAKSELNGNINKKANSTDVYIKTETYSKTEADSKINIAKDAITSSVASTYETKTDVTSKINGVNSSISSLQTRMSSAESKITEDSITNTVKKNFYTKTETEGQITSKGYQTASQVQQKVDSVAFNFQESGGYNLIPNSRWENDWWNWANHAGSNASIIRDSITNLPYVRMAHYAGVNHMSVTIVKVEKGRTYTVSSFVDLETNVQAGLEISYVPANGKQIWKSAVTTNPDHYKNSILHQTFTPDVSCDVTIGIYSYGNRPGAVNGGFARFRWVQLEQGSSHHQWSPHPYEVYQGQTSINKNGIRVNASNVATYTEMHAGGFFVKENNGNIIFGATDTIRLYGPNNVKAFEVRRVENAAYGNATIEICGGINFIHKPGVSVGTNGLMLGNDDRSNAYGYHNLSIKCWNSMGIADNNNLTNMFLDARRGRWIMKGAVYQNTQTPPAAYKLSNNENSELFSGYTVSDITDSILGLYTTIKVDSDEDYTMMILPSGNDLVTTMIDNQPHIDHSSVVAGLVEVVKRLNTKNKELELRIEKIEDQKTRSLKK